MCGEGLPRRGRDAAASGYHRPLTLESLLELRVPETLGYVERVAPGLVSDWWMSEVVVAISWCKAEFWWRWLLRNAP